MSNKPRVLFVTETQKLSSGFGVYSKEILSRLYKTGKYDMAEFTCYASPDAFNNTDWLVYCNGPLSHETDYNTEHTNNPAIQWGITRFERVCLDFKPDIVVTYRDPWMDCYIADSPFLPFFHWVWMPTIDSEPQKLEWLYQYFNLCDGLLAYSEYGIRTLEKQTHGRIVPVGCASPAIDGNVFEMILNKEQHKQSFGLPGDSFIVGTVMRNQKRKMFPDLMRSFKDFVDAAPSEIAEKSFLYLHTNYPEKQGWDLTSLIHEYGIGSKVLCTYTCQNCKQFFVAHYRDALTICDHCGTYGAVLPGVSNGVETEDLVKIYNLMDLYVQYAICLGKDEEIKIKRDDKPLWIPISKVKVGDLAWTHKSRWKPVTNVWKNLAKSHNEKVLELSIYGEYETLKATENHELPAYTSNEIPHNESKSLREKLGDKLRYGSKIPEPGKYELGQLKKGDLLLYPIDDSVVDIDRIDLSKEIDDTYIVTDDYIEVVGGYTYPRYVDIDNEFCRFIGLFVADGSSSSPYIIRITSHIDEADNHALAIRVFDKLKSSLNKVSVRFYKDRKGRDDSLYSILHNKVFANWCSKKENKCLPDWCMKLPIEKQKEILVGMFMGDGHYCEAKNYSVLSTISPKMAQQIKDILRRLRIPFSTCKTIRSKYKTTDQRHRKDCYRFEIYGFNIKSGEMSSTRRGTNNVYYKTNHLMKIKEIREIEYDDDVWCLTVQNDNTFTTRICSTNNCEGFGLPGAEASACGVPVAAIDYSAMEDVVRYVKGYPIPPNLARELETNADRSGPNNEALTTAMLSCAKQNKDKRNKQRLATRKGCLDRYSWDKAAQAWENYLDKVERKDQEGKWQTPPLMKPIPQTPPTNLPHPQFAEWICTQLIQDEYSAFNYRMLAMIRHLNFGASFGPGHLSPCTQESLYNEYTHLAQRRYLFDSLRCGIVTEEPQHFIVEAHKRLKK